MRTSISGGGPDCRTSNRSARLNYRSGAGDSSSARTKDDPDAAVDLLESTGVRFEQLYDPDAELLRQLRTVQGLPITLVPRR